MDMSHKQAQPSSRGDHFEPVSFGRLSGSVVSVSSSYPAHQPVKPHEELSCQLRNFLPYKP